MDVVIRNAHPGPGIPPYSSMEEKLADARFYRKSELIPWTVLADTLDGRVHKIYGGLSDPSYLIDADGNVAHYNIWTSAPTLNAAIEELLEKGGRGIVKGGVSRPPQVSAALTNGWRALRRGVPQSVLDLETAVPGLAISTWLGYQVRGLLKPFGTRITPLPAAIRGAFALLGTLGAAGLVRRSLR